MQTHSTTSFGLNDLILALRERIDADTHLLAMVSSYCIEDRTTQNLDVLDNLTPLDDVEVATGGKIRKGQARWDARNRDQNGLADAFVKLGRRLFINIPVYIRLKTSSRHEARK